MTDTSSRKTGNEPVEGADPGGTHSTKPGSAAKKPGAATGDARESASGNKVQSGDQNDNPSRP